MFRPMQDEIARIVIKLETATNLKKAGALNDEEFAALKRHLNDMACLHRTAAECALLLKEACA